jgi:hypothetical protein
LKQLIQFISVIFTAFTATAQSNYCLSLNGTNNYVAIGTPLSTNSSYTKEAWVYQTTSSGARNIISSVNTPFWINGGILSAGQAGSYSLVTDPSSFPLNVWVHVAVTYDAATTTMKLYRDGILISTNNAVSSYSSENTFIGSHQGSSSFFQGNIDEVRIWNTALTQAQLKQNMYNGPANNASGLVAYYRCNDGSGSTLTSSCTNTSGLNGTLQNSPTWIASPVQFAINAISFDGTNDAVTISDDNTLDITTAITLEAWCYATKNSGIQNVISKSSNTINTGYIFPRTDDGWSHVVLYLHLGGSWRTLSATYPSLNTWHHLAATYDGAMMRLYIDGVQAASQAQTGTIATNSNPLALGNQTGFSEYFGGYADEFRIWNVARTQTEIQNNMSKELNPTTQTGLVSYYINDQGITAGTNTGLTNLIDQKGNNNGSLSNFALSGSSSNFVSQYSSLTVLPVSLISFTAQEINNAVLLKWSTASEQNSRDFTVQHSTNGNDWSNIISLPAAGNSNNIRNYSYVHTNPSIGNNYYRILQTDLNGNFTFSKIRIIKFTNEQPVFRVINPVSNGLLQVQFNNAATLSLYSADGKLFWKKQFSAGMQVINTSGYARGMYFLKSNETIEKILIQ